MAFSIKEAMKAQNRGDALPDRGACVDGCLNSKCKACAHSKKNKAMCCPVHDRADAQPTTKAGGGIVCKGCI